MVLRLHQHGRPRHVLQGREEGHVLAQLREQVILPKRPPEPHMSHHKARLKQCIGISVLHLFEQLEHEH